MGKSTPGAQVCKALLCTGLVLASAPSWAQAIYGSIYGTVTDTAGAVIPNANVTVTDIAKGTSTTVQTNGDGLYSVQHLIPDPYTIEVKSPGFTDALQKGVQVAADTSPKVDFRLQVGTSAQVIQVNDLPPQLQTDRADVAMVLNQKTIEDLPVLGRNFTSFQLLIPGAQAMGWGNPVDENPQGSQTININGQNFSGTGYELDGTDDQDPLLGSIVINPPLDAISESKIDTQNYDAEFGKATTAVITVQTKSGSNGFHGSAFEFRHSPAQQARDPFSEFAPNALTGLYIPSGLFNQFGGSLGGPIKRDRLFFFADYQGLRQKFGEAVQATVPTALVQSSCLSGPGCDFSEYLASNRQLYNTSNPLAITPFPGNFIPRSYLSQTGLNLLKLFPAPTASGTVNNFTASGTGSFNNNQFDVRIDGQITPGFHAFGRYSYFSDRVFGPVAFGALGGPGLGNGGYGGTSQGRNQNFAGGGDIAVNSKLFTDFRIGYLRYHILTQKYDTSQSFSTSVGIPGLNLGTLATQGAPGFFVDGVSNFGSNVNVNRCNCPLDETEDQTQIVNNWTKLFGNHSVKAGADLRYARNLRVPNDSAVINISAGPTSNPAASVPGGLGLATMMLGNVTSFTRSLQAVNNAKEFQKRTFFYGQDTWRIRPNLTLNYGLRWDIYFPEAVNGKGHGSLLNLNTGDMQVAGYGRYGTNMGIQKNFTAFAPRLGVSYQVRPTTVIRAGYGRAYDMGIFGANFGHIATQNLPVLVNQDLEQPSPTSSVFALSQGPPMPTFPTVPADGNLPLPDGVGANARPQRTKLVTVDAWNLTVQQQVTPSVSFSLAYVGNKGTHVYTEDDAQVLPNEIAESLNGITFDPRPGTIGNNSNLRKRYYSTYGWTQAIQYYGLLADNHYNALQLSAEKRLTNGLQLTANYAWQRAFDYGQDYFTVDKKAVYGRNDDLRENVLTVFGNYLLPVGRGQKLGGNSPGWLNAIIGGYQLNANLNWSSGLPFTPSYNSCSSDIDNGPCRPNFQRGASFPMSAGSFDTTTHTVRYFNPVPTMAFNGAVSGPFSRPGIAQFGDVGRNNFFGPGFFNTDASIYKAFQIRESINAQFRFNAYNVFNHINPGQPNGCIDCTVSSNAGVITSEAIGGQPRQLEFAVRLTF